MARFRPFRGIRYAAERVGALDAVVAPPYDVIDPAMRDALYDKSPYNVTRIDLCRDGHDRAAETYREWLSSGVLMRDGEPSFYVYAQDFEAAGEKRSRVGVLGALGIEPFERGVVLRHETTFAHHKTDRLELTRRVDANLSPIFGLYSRPGFVPEPDAGWQSPPDIDVVHQGVRHRLWVVRDPERIRAIEEAVVGEAVFIADGHHRYETALNYWYQYASDGTEPPAGDDGPGDEELPAAHVLAFLAAFEDPGLVILPTHRELIASGGADHARFVAELESEFRVERFARTPEGRDALLAALAGTGIERNAFAIALAGVEQHLLVSCEVAKDTDSPLATLDVKVLHQGILGRALVAAGGGEPKLAYSVDERALLDRVDAGELEGCFLMNATRAEQMAAVCRAGELMPQKSTYFYPKLLTGLVFHSLKREE